MTADTGRFLAVAVSQAALDAGVREVVTWTEPAVRGGGRDDPGARAEEHATRYASPVSGLEDFARLVDGDHGLCVVSTLRPDGTIQSSVVNAGVLPHPVTGEQVVGLVSRGDANRLANLRARPRATVVIRAGWQWVATEGPVELVGPDDYWTHILMAGLDHETYLDIAEAIVTIWYDAKNALP